MDNDNEFVMTKIVDDVQKKKEEAEPILKSQIAKKRNSLDCFIIKTLINIQIENGPHKVLSLEDYQQKLKENVSITFSSDQIKKWLNIIGLKWREESKELEENTENQSSTEEFTSQCCAEVKTEQEDDEFIETDDIFIEEVKLECTEPKNEEEDLSFTLEDDEMTNEEIKPSTTNIEMEEETQNINVKLEMEENNEIYIKTELSDIEDEVQQADLINIEELNQTINNVTNINTENCLDETNIPFVYLAPPPIHPRSKGEIIEELNQTINTENCLDETNVPSVYFAPPPIHPLAEKIITHIGINCGSKGEIPYFHFILDKVQAYDKNINNETLELWLKELKITYRRNNRISRTHKYLPTYPNHETFPTFDYFHQNMNKTRYKCSKGSLMKWLQLLQIDVQPFNYESEVKKTGDKLSSPIIKHLIQLEKDFYRKGLNKHQTINLNKNKSTKDTELIPTLDYFYHRLKTTNKICCKLWLKKWLQFLNITFDSTNCDLGKRCDSPEEPPSPSVIKLLIQFEENSFHKEKTTEPGVLVRMLEDLDHKFKNINEIPTLNFIYLYYINKKAFKRHYSKKRLMDWLTVLNINFINEIESYEFDKNLDKRASVLFCDKDPLPNLEYFYNKINERDYVCSKITLMKWLEILTIKYELKGNNLETNQEDPDQPLSSGIMNSLINLEDDFYKSKENSLVLPRFLVDLETQFKKENKVPTLNDFQQKVVNSKIFQSSQACCKNNIKSLLTRLNIFFILETSFNVSPTLSYFHEKLLNRTICDVSLSQLNVWLNDVGIAFKNDLKNLVIEKAIIKPISNELRQLLCDIDHEYRVKDLIAHLKNVEKDFDKHRKCLTFENIYEIIKTTNLFNTDVSTDYKKSSLKKWVRKLGIKFADTKEEEPSLDYFHEKIKIIEGITVSKDLLAKWLNQIEVKFKDNHLITDNTNEPPAPAKIIPTLRQISKYHCLWDVESILKKIENKFISRGQVPSIDYLEKKLSELKGKHYCKKGFLKNWLTFVGIAFRNQPTKGSREVEKDIDSDLKKKSKRNTRNYKPTQTVNTEEQASVLEEMDVIEIDNDDDESTQETEVIEVEDDDSEDVPKKKKYKRPLLDLETPSTSKKPKPSTSKKPKPSASKKPKSSKRQFVSKNTESPKIITEPSPVVTLHYKNTSAPGDEIVEIPQQTEVIEIEDDDSEDMPKKSPLLVLETTKTESSKHQFVSDKTESPKSIAESSSSELLHSNERPSAPDELMRVLTDVEYNYFRMKIIPTLEQFYNVIYKNFGNVYSKDVVKRWLIKTRIKFASNS